MVAGTANITWSVFHYLFAAQTRASISRFGFATGQPNNKLIMIQREQNAPLLSFDNTEFKSSDAFRKPTFD